MRTRTLGLVVFIPVDDIDAVIALPDGVDKLGGYKVELRPSFARGTSLVKAPTFD